MSPLALKGQSKSFRIKQERAATTSTEGLPERGAFRFDYAYSGEDIDALVRLSRNGEVIAELNGLSAISSATLAELNVGRGDNLELFVEFGIVSATVNVDNALQGSPVGDWRFSSGFNFFLIGPEGNVQKFLGTMNFAYKLTPPWNGIEMKADPPVINQGEASTITLQSIEAPGTPVTVPDVTYINVQIGIIGRLAGGISLPEFDLRYTAGFSNAPYGFITDTPILYEAFPDSIAPLPIDSAAVPIVAFSPFNTEINGSTRVSVKGEEDEERKVEILLGETKYFYAVKDPNDSDKLKIKSTDTPYNTSPTAPEGAIAGVFGNNPIEVLSGGKSGVYWEQKWPKISINGNLTMNRLSNKLIRLVGRYWEAGKEYTVKLKATDGTRSGELEIKVVRPDRLGNKYGKARDVFDKVVDIDSQIITNAGKYGIPPQIIKAHISGEVYTKDFGGEIGKGFTPGYLYEPFTVEFWLRDQENGYKLSKEWADNIFKVSKASMGSGGAVPKHMHTEKQVYPTTSKTVWDMISKYSSIEHASPPGEFNSYAKRKNGSTNELIFYNYNDPRRIYDAIIIEVKEKNKKLKEEEVFKKANDSLTVYLKTKWRGGLDSLYAQTRIAASYGYFQVLYTTGILPISSYGANYPKNEIPEKINETETNFQLAMTKYQYLLKEKEASNWNIGYEKVWFDLLSNWNSKTTYNTSIFKKIETYLPLAK